MDTMRLSVFVTIFCAIEIGNALPQAEPISRVIRSNTGADLTKQVLSVYQKLFSAIKKETKLAKGVLFETVCTDEGCTNNSHWELCSKRKQGRNSSSKCTPGKVKYLGCYEDRGKRIFDEKSTGSLNPNGLFECQRFCGGYKYFGLEYTSQCFCGNTMKNYPKRSGCSHRCKNNNHLFCGGTWRISVYENL